MKTGIIIAMAALGLAIFAVPDTPAEARGGWHHGPDVNQRFSGSTFVVDADAVTGNQTSLLNALCKGQPGTAQLASLIEFGPAGPDDRCPSELPFGAEIISQTWVQTYNDGSLLTGTTDSGSFLCSHGIVFAAEVSGTITGGTRRFKNASGTWKADARTENSGLTGHIKVDLN